MIKLSKYTFILDPCISGSEYVLRTQPPIIIGQVMHGDVNALIIEYQPIAVGKFYENNEWAIFFAGKLDDTPLIGTAQEQADRLGKIMRKMADFYNHNQNKKI